MAITKILGYTFANKDFLRRALTRRAYALEQKHLGKPCEDQEILRTLGDAVLKAILVDLLIKSGCKTREEITVKKKDIEREEALAKLAQNLGIGPLIKLGKGEERQGADKEPKVLAETLEALIGAIYLDGGYNAAKQIIAGLFAKKKF